MNDAAKTYIDYMRADLLHGDYGSHVPVTVVADLIAAFDRALADMTPLANWEAIRQTVNCPTCEGTHEVESPATNAGRAFVGDACPDCTDGKIDMARLLAVGAAVFNAEYMNRQAGEWRPVIVNALPSGSPRAAVFAEQLLDYLLQVQP